MIPRFDWMYSCINLWSVDQAIAVKNILLDQLSIISIYNSNDGQLGIKFKNILNDFVIGIVGLYSSPSNYRYGQDAGGFFNNVAVLWQDLYD